MLQADKLASQIGKRMAQRLLASPSASVPSDSTSLAERELSPSETTEKPTEHDSLTAFKLAVSSIYKHAKHLALLDEYLEKVTRYVESGGNDGIGRLIIAMPPRHGKSLTVSKLYPPWHLGRNPNHRVMAVSYGQSLANKNSRYARNMVRSSKIYQEIFPHTRIDPMSRSVQSWDVVDTGGEGGMEALGVFGPSSGKGAHVLILDDLIKSRKQAESATVRQSIWDAIQDDLLTRLAPGGAVILMATRWHQDDPTGRFLKEDPDGWVVLRLPALAEENDPLGRKPGEALWPERFNQEVLEERKKKSGAYGWTSLYQQDPKPSEGGIFKAKWFKPYVRVIPELVREVRYWDLAMSEKTTADFTAGVKMGRGKDDHHYITDVARAQVELADLPKFIKDVMLSDGPSVHQGFENKGYMTRAIQSLLKDPQLAKFVIKGYPADADKLTRALPFAARATLELIHIADKPFADPLVEEFKVFPNGTNDDQVDGASGAWEMINEPPRKPPSVEIKQWA